MQQQQLFRSTAPAVDPAELRTKRCWEWVCGALVTKDKAECAVSVLDTVFIEKQQIWSWFYSTSGGVIRKKPRAQLSADTVHHAFCKIAGCSELGSDAVRVTAGGGSRLAYAAICCFGDQIRTMQFFSAHELSTFLTSLAGASSSACLSAFVAPRGGDLDPLKYANLEHEFTLSKSGRPQCKLYRLALGGQRIMSMDVKMNGQVNDLVQLYVSFVEQRKRVRVVSCVSLFVLDDFGRLFLWRTSSFETIAVAAAAPPSTLKHATDPTASPLITGGGGALSGMQQRGYDGPHAVNERILARAKAEALRKPDERLIDAILSSPTPQQKRPLLLSTSSSSPSLRDPSPGTLELLRDGKQSQLRNSRDWDAALQYLPPSSSLSRGRRRTISAAHLASSQKKGCCGDYCRIAVDELAAKRMEGKKKLGDGGHAQVQLPSPFPGSAASALAESEARRRSSVYTATAAANAFLESRASDDPLRFQPRVGNPSDSLEKPSSPQRQQHEETVSQSQYAIPFKLIAQTRAEKQFVDLFVRRYHNGEDGEYLAEEYYGDGEPLGQTFPGYYYQEVHVCQNCFAFYTLVERVRMKALNHIAKQRTSKGRRVLRGEQRAATSSSLLDKSLTRGHRLNERIAEQDERDDDDEDAYDAERVWPQVWRHAGGVLQHITKKDAAELYSFTNPHPAVAMVLSCLGLVLLGREADWTELKRSVSQEKLLGLLHTFELDHLSLETVAKAAAHARNPLFSPVHIVPISSCAARFCDWILTVLQTYAWRHRDAFKDDATSRVLLVLKPELLPDGVADSVTSADRRLKHTNNGATAPSQHRSQEQEGDKETKTKPGRQKEAARRAIQEQQMARLAAPAGLADVVVSGGSDGVFTCQDGVTKIPYAMAGQAAGETVKCNLVVFHDLFDTLDSTKVFFRPVLARNVGARALFFNLPGQAGSAYTANESGSDESAEKPPVFNNVWQARRVHELLNYLQRTKKFLLSGMPFHLVGFGNGANIATCYTILHGKAYNDSLQSLVLCNGFAKVDAQLAAILHSAVNVFSCFPPSRPDLPITFFCKFLFSDAYLAKIDANLALSIYTAVTNAITLDGRIRLCQGALRHVDLVSQLPEIDVPLVLVQSVENALVAPANADPFLQSRASVLHAWSHQQSQGGDARGKTSKQLRQVLGTPKSAFVSWLRAGHELRQECKAYMTDLMELLVNSKEHVGSDAGQEAESAPRTDSPEEQARRPQQELVAAKASSQTGPADVRLPRSMPTEDNIEPAAKSDAVVSRPQPSQSLTSPLIEEVDATSSAVRPTLKKSAYELQLERSEREFQDAVKTHEAQKAELEKKRWLARQTPSEGLHSSAETAVQSSPAPAAKKKLELSSPPPTIATTSTRPQPHSEAPRSTPLTKTGAPDHSTTQQRVADPARDPTSREIDALQQKMAENEERVTREAEALRAKQRATAEERLEALQQEQERRRREWEQEDEARIAALEKKLREEQAERLAAVKKRDLELLALDLSSSLAVIEDVPRAPVSTIAQRLQQQQQQQQASSPKPLVTAGEDLKQQLRQTPDLPSVFDQLEADEMAKKKRIGALRVDAFAGVKASLQQAHNDGVREHENAIKVRARKREHAYATCIQKYVRRHLAIRRVAKLRNEVQQARITRFAGGEIVRVARGFLGRRRFTRLRAQREQEARWAFAAVVIQRLFRGHACRVAFARKLRAKKALVLQRVYRGHVGRVRCEALRKAQVQRRYMDRNAAKLQATWKMYVARDRFQTARFSVLAAVEIQRVYRGHLGRLEAARKKQWRDAEPGPERLALGLQLIEGSKQAFERQQSEIDALHRAQEAVERQVSTIHSELQESEKELAVLERELQEIDQLEVELRELTHEAEMLHSGGVEGLLRSNHSDSSNKKPTPLGCGIPEAAAVPYAAGVESHFETKESMRKRQADAYAVEMAIQIKRAEREKRKKDLEAEFTSVFSEVQQKRQALARMEEKLADMEATRMRKDREFARLQRHLMELLEEQKLELENLREKGIELETATATSAAAAAATAVKAKEHEKRSQAMFESTEELMKFQFMSMSLSYFSSLSMLKNLRDINADTTSAAITSTAETAAAAAAAAAAANIPAMNRLKVGGADLMAAASQLKKQELEHQLADEEAAKKAQLQPLPPEVRDWNVDDVGRWLDALALPQYKKAFAEGAVDGEFLLELRPEDMADVLGVTHKLHVRKLVVARNKLLPLTAQERTQLAAVQHEEGASQARAQAAVPDLDTVFSQARNGRLKRLMESVDAGFSIDAEDDKGNTLLLLACQNVNVKMVEYLVAKRANVNHRNAQGNTPLHFAMAYDADGALGEYLIARGADDTIENAFGLTPYDGLTPE